MAAPPEHPGQLVGLQHQREQKVPPAALRGSVQPASLLGEGVLVQTVVSAQPRPHDCSCRRMFGAHDHPVPTGAAGAAPAPPPVRPVRLRSGSDSSRSSGCRCRCAGSSLTAALTNPRPLPGSARSQSQEDAFFFARGARAPQTPPPSQKKKKIKTKTHQVSSAPPGMLLTCTRHFRHQQPSRDLSHSVYQRPKIQSQHPCPSMHCGLEESPT